MTVVCRQKLKKIGKGGQGIALTRRRPEAARRLQTCFLTEDTAPVRGLYLVCRNFRLDRDVSVVIGGRAVWVLIKAPRRRLRRGALFFATI